MLREKNLPIINAGEVATYSVCPEAWRLKRKENVSTLEQKGTKEGKKLRYEWHETQDLTRELSEYVKIIFYLILLIGAIAFISELERVEKSEIKKEEAPN